MAQRNLIYTTKNGVAIVTEPGKKSEFDFKVRYREPNKRLRTPKHIHLIIDLYLKKAGNKELTMELVKEFLQMLSELEPSTEYPPSFQKFSPNLLTRYKGLNAYGEYSVEFLAAIFDLIMIQEKTNYPDGTINKKLFEAFLNEEDIFSVVSSATFR